MPVVSVSPAMLGYSTSAGRGRQGFHAGKAHAGGEGGLCVLHVIGVITGQNRDTVGLQGFGPANGFVAGRHVEA